MNYDWDSKPDLNITPLVDVMLVLLAVLMITVPSILYEEQIILPSGSKSTMKQKSSVIELRIDRDRNVYLDSLKWDLSNFYDNFLLKTKSYNKKSSVYIRADKDLRYDDVMNVLRIVKNSGFVKVSLITDG